jgi:hypothetical protein
VSFNNDAPTRFFGMVQLLSDPSPLVGRSIAYQRLVDSQLFQENELLRVHDQNLPPRPMVPYLRLVAAVSPY